MKRELMIALYSIKPIYSEQIINGNKKYELRKRMPARHLDYILIYSSSPTSKVVGYAVVKKIHKKQVANLWMLVSEHAGITKKDYMAYFKNSSDAYALELGEVKRFVKPFSICEINPNCVPPQSFSYVDNNHFTRLRKRKTELV